MLKEKAFNYVITKSSLALAIFKTKIMQKTKIQKTNFLLYSSGDEQVFVEVYFKDENIWLTQKLMSQLFDVDSDSISYHLKNIYKDGELVEKATTKEISVVQKEGNREVIRKLKFYNLDAIISVGYRVNSLKATKFRIWATNKLKEFIIKGFVLDDERLKNGQHFDKNYFEDIGKQEFLRPNVAYR